MERSDEQLVAAYLDGEREALDALVQRHFKMIYNFAYRFVGNSGDAEDVTQEVFVKVWRYAKKFRPEANFKTWLFTIAHRTTIDFLRKRKRIVFSDMNSKDDEYMFADTIVDTEPLPDELFARAEDKALVESLFMQLSPEHRLVLHLHYYEGMTFDEIGHILEKPLNTVKSQHRRAVIAMRKLLDAPKY